MTDYLVRKPALDDPRTASVADELSFWASRFGRLLFEHLELVPGVVALDLGCGTGFPLFELAHAHGGSSAFVGVDIWGEAVRRAARKLETYELTNVELVRADGAALPFAKGEFDLIVSNLGVNNFKAPEAALAECGRVARPGARLVLTTNVRGHMRELYELYRETLIDLGLDACLTRLAAEEDHRASKDSLAERVRAAGFEVTRAIEDRFELRYLSGGALLRHWLTRVGFLDGWRSVVDPADEVRVFAALERRLDALAAARGGLRMGVPMLYLEARRR